MSRTRLLYQEAKQEPAAPPTERDQTPDRIGIQVNFKDGGGRFRTYEAQAAELLENLMVIHREREGGVDRDRSISLLFSGNVDQFRSLRNGFNATRNANDANWRWSPSGQSAVVMTLLKRLSASRVIEEQELLNRLKLVAVPTIQGLPCGFVPAKRNPATQEQMDEFSAYLREVRGTVTGGGTGGDIIVGYRNQDTQGDCLTQVGGGTSSKLDGIHRVVSKLQSHVDSLRCELGHTFKIRKPLTNTKSILIRNLERYFVNRAANTNEYKGISLFHKGYARTDKLNAVRGLIDILNGKIDTNNAQILRGSSFVTGSPTNVAKRIVYIGAIAQSGKQLFAALSGGDGYVSDCYDKNPVKMVENLIAKAVAEAQQQPVVSASVAAR